MGKVFLLRDAMHKRGLCCRPVSVSVCPSVRLSVTLVYCIHTAEDVVKLFSRSSHHSSFLIPSAATQFQGEPLQHGRKKTRGWGILRFSTEIAVYLRNGTR